MRRLPRCVVPIVVWALVLSLPLGAWAADEPEPISPDRAGASNDTSTVGAGVIQIETGLAYGHERISGGPSARSFSVEAAVRWGLTERFEIGVEGEPVVRMRGPEDDTGLGDLTLNARYRFLDARPGSWFPSLALQPFVKLPFAKEPIGSGKTDFGALLLASFALPGQIDLDLNAGLTAVGQSRPDGYLLQAVAALGLSRDLSESVTLFTDLLYTSRAERAGGDSVLVDFGVIWQPTRDMAFDASLVTYPVGTGTDWTVRAGVSLRFGR
jgi:hypothetical protein